MDVTTFDAREPLSRRPEGRAQPASRMSVQEWKRSPEVRPARGAATDGRADATEIGSHVDS